MSELGLSFFGAYVPRLRLERAVIAAAHSWAMPSLAAAAKGSRAFASWDEDAITMAVEAARDALDDAPVRSIAALRLASTRLPYADLQNAAAVAGAIGLDHAVASSDVAGSQRAGTSALLQALKGGETTLVVAADNPVAKAASLQELAFGAGAAAFLVSDESVGARLLGSASITDFFVDHFRSAGSQTDYQWEERWVRDAGYGKIVPAAVAGALEDSGLAIDDIQHFVMPSPLRGIAGATAKALKFTGSIADGLEDGVGIAGAAHPLLMLAAALEQAEPGDRILLVGFGQGADALIFEVTGEIAKLRPRRGVAGSVADGLPTDSYLRMLSFHEGIAMDWGMRSEKNAKTSLTEQYRASDQMQGFNAGRCSACGTIQFPQLQYCVNCHAPGDAFTAVPLRDEPAKVLTATADWLSYHPAPPLYVGFVQFNNGARLQMEMVDVGPGGLDVGRPLRMVYRIKEKDHQRGYNRYFWKAAPLQAS
jgi:3-hydroxy-3-methylglutaryl CoA synthase